MIATVDLNVVIDVFCERAPFFADSLLVLEWIENGWVEGVFASHALTTLYYSIRKASGKTKAEEAVEYVLQHFEIRGITRDDWHAALESAFDDFEDAGIAKVAELSGSAVIVTRNTDDFEHSTVPAVTPANFISRSVAKSSAGPQTPP